MIIDASAVVAILLAEAENTVFSQAIEDDDIRIMSAAGFVEVSMVMHARRGLAGDEAWDNFMLESQLEIVPFTVEQARTARYAFRRYGKGHHPAKLNFGDCMSYAAAKDTGEPLLCKGEDFLQTDLEIITVRDGQIVKIKGRS